MTLVTPEVMFQATDLARRSRDVLDSARHGYALIRDKDGMAFEVVPAGEAARSRYALHGIRHAVLALRLLATDRAHRDPVLYGDLAWLAVLPDEEQERFVWEYITVLEASAGLGTEPVEQLLYEWQQTARVHADPDLLAELTADIAHPLVDVEL